MTGSYSAAFFAGAALMLVGIFLLYFVQRLRPDLTASKPWPEPINGQQHNSNLIPGPSIESLISGLDTLSGLCVTKPSPVHLSPGQMELGDYHRFGHNETDSKSEFAASQTQAEGGPCEVEVTADVTSVTLECASLETDNADHRSFSRDSTGPAISLDTTDHNSCISVSRDPVDSEMLAVPPRDAESVLSGSVLSYTGNISMSGTYLEGCNVSDSARLEMPGNYEVRSNISSDAGIAGIVGEIQLKDNEEPEILVDVSSSETSAVAIDVQSLVSWESADRGEHHIPQTGSEIEIIKLQPPPSSTKQNPHPSLITLETSVDEETAPSIEHAVNLELQTSPDAGRDAKFGVPEGNEISIMMANDMPHNVEVASGNLTQKEGRHGEPRQISEDLACRMLSNVDDVEKIWESMTQSHPEAEVDVSITSESASSRDGGLSTAFQELEEPLPPQEQWLLETEMQILRSGTETASRPDSISHLSSSDTSVRLVDGTGAMTAVASTEEQCLPPTVVDDVTHQLTTVGPYDIEAKQSVETSLGPVPHESASAGSRLDEKEQPTAPEELVRLPPPPRIPRTGTLIVVQDVDPLNSFTAEVGVAGADAFVRQVLEECVNNEPLDVLKTATSTETVCITYTVPADQALIVKDSFMQENDAFVRNQAAPTTLAATVDVEYVQLPPPPAIPRIGTLIPLEEDENERIHQTDMDKRERGSETLLSTESDSALILLEVSPKQSTTALSPGLLSIEDDPLTTRQSIGAFHRTEPRSHASINEPSQLSLLSQRLEAVAARQFEEEQSELITSTNDSMAFMVSSNQSALSTPLFSANHSVPLTPMRVFSSYLVTPALTAAQTPYIVPFSSTDASIIQTPAEASFLRSPAESGTVDSDIELEFGFEPSSHALFTEDTSTERGANGSYGPPWNTPTQTHTSDWNLDNPGIADAQALSVSGAVSPGNQRDTDCPGMAKGLEGRKSKSDLFNSQAQDPNAAQTVAQSTNPFHLESAEDDATSISIQNGLLASQPPAEQFWNTAADTDEYDGQPLKSASLVEIGEGNTEKEQVVTEDLNSLFSSNPFLPPTLNEAIASSNAQPFSLSDPWCPQPEFVSTQHPVESCIKLDPPPLTSRRKRTASDNQEYTEADRGQDVLAHFPICEETKDQVGQVESCEVRKDVISMGEYEDQEQPASGNPTNTPASPIHDVKAALELFPSQCEQVPEANHLSAEGKTNLDDIVMNPLHEVICAGDVPALTIEDATSISDNGVKPADNLPTQSYDEVTSQSNNVTIQPNDDIIQSLNYILMKPDGVSNQSESQLTIEMQSDDYATMQTDDSMSHRRTYEADEGSIKRGDEVTSRLDDVISQITEHQCHDDDTALLLHTKDDRFCFVRVEDGELERTSSTSSVATDESSSMDTSLSENEMPYRKLQGENSSCEHLKTP